MKKRNFVVFLSLLLVLLVCVYSIEFKKKQEGFSKNLDTVSLHSSPQKQWPFSEYVFSNYIGYSPSYFLSISPHMYAVKIIQKNENVFVEQTDFNTKGVIKYVCTHDQALRSGYLLKCKPHYLKPIYIKFIMDTLDDSSKERVIFVSIGDNKECIKKYNRIEDFEKYCNPENYDDISLLNLYNLHIFNNYEHVDVNHFHKFFQK
ncbi:MAG: hypothetical protein JXR30_01295 [Alphaproteobacteria bacterium]|nr:hypothetical protein [Alphaproteobacteria bacterium]